MAAKQRSYLWNVRSIQRNWKYLGISSRAWERAKGKKWERGFTGNINLSDDFIATGKKWDRRFTGEINLSNDSLENQNSTYSFTFVYT